MAKQPDGPEGEHDAPPRVPPPRAPGTIQAPVPPMARPLAPASPASPAIDSNPAIQSTLSAPPAALPARAAARPLEPGDFIANYQVDKKIGQGGFGEVWRIKHREFGTRRALKVLSSEVSSAGRDRFKQEMQILAQITHNNVVQVIDSGELPDGSPYYIMAWLRGNDLDRELRTKYQGRPPPWSVTREIVLQILSGLEAIHRKRIVHRDLKPHNCMEDPDPSGDDFQTCWKIVDLGIAKRLATEDKARSFESGTGMRRTGTRTGSFIGTLDYAPPEQLAGDSANISYPADIYSVGVMLYQLLTGRVPHPTSHAEEDEDEGPAIRLRRISRERPKPPSEVVGGTFPPEIDAVVLRALRLDPRERFQSAGEFADALRESESGVLVPPKRQPTAPVPAVRSEPAPAPAPPVDVDHAPSPARPQPTSAHPDPPRESAPSRPEPAAPKTTSRNTRTGPKVRAKAGVVFVEFPAPERRSRLPLIALLLLATAIVAVLAIPDLRARVFPKHTPAPQVAAPEPPEPPPSHEPIIKSARAAIHGLGLKETNKTQAGLQRLQSDPRQPPAAIAEARRALAELLLVRALACKIAVALEPSAMGGEALARSTEDPLAARELLAVLPADPRLTVLDALVAGQTPTPAADDLDLSALVRAAPLWRTTDATPQPGLISDLRRLPAPSTLSQSLLALALTRSGDESGAREQLLEILKNVPDQPFARTLLDLLDRQGMMTAAGDPQVVVPPPEPTPPAGKPPRRPKPTDTVGPTKVETMISDGCQKVRAGDPEGVKLLLAAIDRGANPKSNFNLVFCLGNGFARQGAHDTAFTWYAQAVTQSPSNRDAVAGAARSAELLGRTTTAVEFYKKLRELEPTNAAASAYITKHDRASPEDTPKELMHIPKNKR